MKNRSLIGRYAIIYTISIISFMLFAGFVVYGSIANYFEKDAFESIEYAAKNNNLLTGFDADAPLKPNNSELATAARGVFHAYYIVSGDNASPKVRGPMLIQPYRDFSMQILENKEDYVLGEHYTSTVDDKTVYFILNNGTAETRNGNEYEYYEVSFMTNTHVVDLTRALFVRLIFFSACLIIVVSIIGFIMLNTFRKKFRTLDVQLEKISLRKWEEPIEVEGNHEFSLIQWKLEEVRKQLLFYDNEMKHQFHAVSHEFKTPIMIIRGYIDATLDGKYPKGTLEASLKVIDDEMLKLNDMVNKLLYLNKIDYVSNANSDEVTNVKEIVLDRIEYYRPLKENISWQCHGDGEYYRGSVEQWVYIINNLLENQMRYASSIIDINLSESIEIYNDGPEIPNDNLDKIFNTFFKGSGGQSGLGLAIVKKNLWVNGYKISVDNVYPGVKFKIISDKSLK